MSMSPGISPSPSLLTPSASLFQQQQQEEHLQMAATMRMLSGLSGNKSQSQSATASPRLKSVGSVPLHQQSMMLQQLQQMQHQQQQQQQQLLSAGGSSEVQQALSLVSQLQELTLRTQGSADVQTVLAALLPQLMMQVGAGGGGGEGMFGLLPSYASAPIPAGAPHTPSKHQQGGHYYAHLDPGNFARASAPPLHHTVGGFSPCNTHTMGSPSPADVLSVGSRKTGCGSSSYSGSSRSLSPDPSHHSDEGGPQQPRRRSGDQQVKAPQRAAVGLYDAAVGPFSMVPQGLRGLGQPQGLLHDEDLASGMSEMMGSLSLLVDGAELDAHLSQLATAPVY